MNIRSLSDQQLHQNLLNLKSKEDRIIARILSHLEEVYRRRLFSDYKCSSLYDYCVRVLGYSNGEAHRKISACKLAFQCKGVKDSIANGELSLSNAASVQTFLNQSRKQAQTRKVCEKGVRTSHPNIQNLKPEVVIDRVKNKSTRDCEKELQKIASENHLVFSPRGLSKRSLGDRVQLKVELDRDQISLLKTRLGISCEQVLLQTLIQEKIQATEPPIEVKSKPRKSPSRRPRTVSPAKRALVFKRAEKQCENCGSKNFLEIDHRMSVASGGGNELENLRVLCRSCNQRAGIKQLGLPAMDLFINS